jgi:hypothetical protein
VSSFVVVVIGHYAIVPCRDDEMTNDDNTAQNNFKPCERCAFLDKNKSPTDEKGRQVRSGYAGCARTYQAEKPAKRAPLP